MFPFVKRFKHCKTICTKERVSDDLRLNYYKETIAEFNLVELSRCPIFKIDLVNHIKTVN